MLQVQVFHLLQGQIARGGPSHIDNSQEHAKICINFRESVQKFSKINEKFTKKREGSGQNKAAIHGQFYIIRLGKVLRFLP